MAASAKLQWIKVERKPRKNLNYNNNNKPLEYTCPGRRQKKGAWMQRAGLVLALSSGPEEVAVRMLGRKYTNEFVVRTERKISQSRYC
jgi:hypothetical protein